MRWSGLEALTSELAAAVARQQAHATLLLYGGRLCVTRAERESPATRHSPRAGCLHSLLFVLAHLALRYDLLSLFLIKFLHLFEKVRIVVY